jgi:hypothetical protein
LQRTLTDPGTRFKRWYLYQQALTALGVACRWVRIYRMLAGMVNVGILLRPSSSAPQTWEAVRYSETIMSFESINLDLQLIISSDCFSFLICKMRIRSSSRQCVR